MEKLQRRLTHILTNQSEGSAVEKKSLEDEIEDRWKAIERLDTKNCCDLCENPVNSPQVLRFRITHSDSIVGALHISKVHLRSECENCCRTALPGEIVCANLTATQERDLGCLARKLIKQVEQSCKCRIWGTWEDLRHEAYRQTLEGRKKWYPAHVDLFGHLMMAMQNIAWGWGKESHREIPEADSIKYDEKTGEKFSPFDIAESKEARLDRRLIKKQELERSFKTALVIEPDSSVLRLIKLWLERDGFKVIDILTAEEGLRDYSDFSKYIRFDVVVISHSLDVNGVELAMAIRKGNRSQNIIITTTHASEDDVVRPSELATNGRHRRRLHEEDEARSTDYYFHGTL
jgi:CheY-like chemotaxis protein